MNIIVLGAGTFGTAIANELSVNKNNNVTLFSRNRNKVDEINIEHTNKSCFPNKHLTEALQASFDKNILKNANIILVALPSSVIIDTLVALKPYLNKDILFVNLSKGLFVGGVTIVDKIKGFKKKKIHNSTKVFQSLRIFVNKEISELIYGLINSFKILPIGGTIVVVTFHSLEDKIVKFFFKNYSEDKGISRYLPRSKNKNKIFDLISKKAILPTAEEIKINPPSRSAKLRYARKISEDANFDEFFLKFKKLLEIENIGKKL